MPQERYQAAVSYFLDSSFFSFIGQLLEGGAIGLTVDGHLCDEIQMKKKILPGFHLRDRKVKTCDTRKLSGKE